MSLRTFPYWLFALSALTAGHALWRSDVMNQRPYWSSALGVFTEASALAFGDATSESTPAPSAYRHSFVPYLLAGLLKVLPPGTPIVLTFRLISFALVGLMALVVARYLSKRTGWWGAGLAAAGIVTLPVFTVQAELMTETIFMVVAVVFAARLLFARRDVLAALLGVVAFFAKWTGGVYLVVGLVYLVTRALSRRAEERPVWGGLTAHGAGLIVIGLVLWMGRTEGHAWGGWVAPWEFGTSPVTEAWQWCPDLLLLLAVTVVAGFSLAVPTRPVDDEEEEARVYYSDPPLAFGLLLVVGVGVLLATVDAVPADFAVLVPFTVMGFAWVLAGTAKTRGIGNLALFGLTAINLINSQGMLFPKLEGMSAADWRTGALRERSREYLATDHAYYVDATRAIVLLRRDEMVLAPVPFTHFLSLPALGYVGEPLAGYGLGNLSTQHFRPVEELRDDPYRPLTMVHAQNRYVVGKEWRVPTAEPGDTRIYPPDPAEAKRAAYARSPIYVFVPRRVPSELEPDSKLRYLRKLWPIDELIAKARQAAELGNDAEAERVFRKLTELNPTISNTRLELGLVLERQGKTEEALAEYAKIPDGAPERWQVESQLGYIETNRGEFVKAKTHHETALRKFRERRLKEPRAAADLLVRSATNAIGLGQYTEAREKLTLAVAQDPAYAFAQRELGFALQKEGKFQESIATLTKALELNRQDPLTHRYLGGAYAGLKDWKRSEEEFREALRIFPEDLESQDGLSTALERQGRLDEAVQEYEDALAREPNDARRASLFVGLARVQQAQGDHEKGLASLQQAVEADPESKEAANDLAWFRATAAEEKWRDGAEARKVAGILETGEVASPYLDTLAAVRAELGEWEQAVGFAERAVAKAREEKREELASDFAARLELYRQQTPYRQSAAAGP